jgi:hypothetical protein
LFSCWCNNKYKIIIKEERKRRKRRKENKKTQRKRKNIKIYKKREKLPDKVLFANTLKRLVLPPPGAPSTSTIIP